MNELAGKTAFVTGATGFIGGALTQALAEQGVQVRALARRSGRDAHIRDVPNVRVVMGDVTDAARMVELAQGCDLIFHVAAAFNGSAASQRPVNVDSVRHMVRAAAEANAERLVHVSSIAAYGYTVQGIVQEDRPLTPGRVPYNLTKAEGEQVLRAEAARLGVAYSICRPGMVVGPRSGQWVDAMWRLVRRDPVRFLGDGHAPCYTVSAADVVRQLCTLATHPAAVGEAFNCVMWPHPSWRDYLLGLAALRGGGRWAGISPRLLKLVAVLADPLLRLAGQPQDLRNLVNFVAGDTRYSMQKAQDVLGWQPQDDMQATLAACVPYLQAKGWLS